MKSKQYINIGVLTYILLGLFNYIQHGVLLFSYPLVPLFLVALFCLEFFKNKPATGVKNVFLGMFVLLHFLFSPFLLEIALPFERQLMLAEKGITDIAAIVAYLFLVLAMHQNLVVKGKRVYNLVVGVVASAGMFGFLYFPELMFSQLFLALVGLIGGVGGYFIHKHKLQFSDSILLVIGLLYLITCLNWFVA